MDCMRPCQHQQWRVWYTGDGACWVLLCLLALCHMAAIRKHGLRVLLLPVHQNVV